MTMMTNLISDTLKEELKALINEVLDEIYILARDIFNISFNWWSILIVNTFQLFSNNRFHIYIKQIMNCHIFRY